MTVLLDIVRNRVAVCLFRQFTGELNLFIYTLRIQITEYTAILHSLVILSKLGKGGAPVAQPSKFVLELRHGVGNLGVLFVGEAAGKGIAFKERFKLLSSLCGFMDCVMVCTTELSLSILPRGFIRDGGFLRILPLLTSPLPLCPFLRIIRCEPFFGTKGVVQVVRDVSVALRLNFLRSAGGVAGFGVILVAVFVNIDSLGCVRAGVIVNVRVLRVSVSAGERLVEFRRQLLLRLLSVCVYRIFSLFSVDIFLCVGYTVIRG